MTIHRLLEYLASSIELIPDGTMLRHNRAPRGTVKDAFYQQISLRNAEILVILDPATALANPRTTANVSFLAEPSDISDIAEGPWLRECFKCEQKVEQKHLRLFPLLGRQAKTPIGDGVLKQVLQSRAAILMDAPLVFVNHQQALQFDCSDLPIAMLDRPISINVNPQKSSIKSTITGKVMTKGVDFKGRPDDAQDSKSRVLFHQRFPFVI